MAIKATKFIWMDGKFVKWKDAKVHILTRAIHYGSAVFEGIDYIDNVKIGNGKVGEVTAKVRDKCYNIVRGKDRKYNKWLTYI